MSNALTIAQSLVRQDSEGRYCLNDLHKAAGGKPLNQPAYFLRNRKTNELVAELRGNSANLQSYPVSSVPGAAGGTYVVKELVYAYAMWISPKFHIQVIRAYDAMVAGKVDAPKTLRALEVVGHGTLKDLPEDKAKRLTRGTPNVWPKFARGYRTSPGADFPPYHPSFPNKAIPARRLWTLSHSPG